MWLSIECFASDVHFVSIFSDYGGLGLGHFLGGKHRKHRTALLSSRVWRLCTYIIPNYFHERHSSLSFPVSPSSEFVIQYRPVDRLMFVITLSDAISN
jgi:hypothetical protein